MTTRRKSKPREKRALLHLSAPLATGLLCPFEFASGRACQLEAGHERREPHRFEFGVAEQVSGRPLRVLEFVLEIAHGDKPARKPRQARLRPDRGMFTARAATPSPRPAGSAADLGSAAGLRLVFAEAHHDTERS